MSRLRCGGRRKGSRMYRLTPGETAYLFCGLIGINLVLVICGVIEACWTKHKKRLAHAANMDEPTRK